MSISNLLFTSSDGTKLYDLSGTTVTLLAGGSSTPPFLPDPLLSNSVAAVTVGRVTYLTMADSTNTTSAIWSYNGTTVTQITSSSNYVDTTPDGNNLAASAPMAGYNGDLVFSQASLATSADSGAYDRATLAVYDPTTNLVTQPTSPNGGYDPHDFVTLSGTLFFEALDSTTQSQAIYSFNGTTVTEVYNLHPTTTFNVGGPPTTITGAGALDGSLAVFNGSVYFGSGEQTIYQLTATGSLSNSAVNRSGGDVNGSQYDYGSITVDPIVSGNYLYYLANNSGVWSLNTGNVVHSLVGSIGAQDFVPVDNNGTLYFHSENYSPYSTTVPETGSGSEDLFTSTGTSATDRSANFNGSSLITMGGNVYYNNGGGGLGEITGTSTLGTVTVPNGAGGTPLVSIPFSAVSWDLPVTLHDPSLTATGDTTSFVQGGTVGVDLFTAAAANTNDTGQTIAGFTMTITNVTDSLEFIGGWGTGIALVNGTGGMVGQTGMGGGTGAVTGTGTTKTLTVTGLSLSDSAFDTLIDDLQYFNSAGTVTAGARVITITSVTDSGSSNNTDNPSGLVATVNVSATPPSPVVTETLTSDTGISNSDHITSNPALSGSGDANAVVTLTEGTTVLGTTTASGTGAWTFTPTLSDGSHTVVASETNGSGTGTASLTFTLETPGTPLPVTLQNDTGSSPNDKVTSDPTLRGTGAPNTEVSFFDGAAPQNLTPLGSITADGNGAWSFTPSGLLDGQHTITVEEMDAAGNYVTGTPTFTLDTTPPAAPVITSPDLTDNTTPVIAGTAEAGSTVTLTVDGATYSTIATGGVWSVDLSTATPATGSLSPNANGANSVSATATDPAGNTSTPGTQTLTIDTTPPAAPAITTPDLTDSTAPVIAGTAEAGSTVTLTVDGATYSTIATGGVWSVDLSTATPATGSLSPNANGANSVSATATDPAGNTSTPGTQTLTIDTTPPDAPVITSPDLTNNTTPVIAGTAEAGSTVTLTVDGATYSTIATGGVWSVDLSTATPATGSLSPNANGANSVSATATDPAGNTSTPGTQTLTIDTTPPAAPVITSPDLTDNTTPVIAGTAEAGSTVTLTVDGATYSTIATGGVWSVDLSTATPATGSLSPNANGANSVSATATDPAGNASAPGTQTLTIDTTPPDAPVITSPDLTNNTTPVIAGTAEAGSTVTLTVDGATYSTIATGGVWSVDLSTATPATGSLSPNANGANSVSATATDPAGNASAPGTQTLTIDTTPPAAPVITSPDLTDNTTPVIAGTAEAGSTVTLTVDGATYSTIATGGVWSVDLSTATPATGSLSPNANGANSVSATATDPAGNASAPGTQTLTIDTTPPDAPVITSPDLTNNTTPVIAGTAEAGSTVTLTVDGATYSTIATGGVWSVDLSTATPATGSLSPNANGANSVSATATDPAGNASAPGTQTLTIDTTRPTPPANLALAPGSDSGVLGDDLTNVTTPTLTGTGETGDTLTLYDGEVTIGTTTVVNGHWSVTPSVALSAGSHAIMARQTDPAGNVSFVSSLLPLAIDTTLPVAPAGLGLAPISDSGTLGDGITSATRPLIIGTGTAGDTVKIYNGTTLLGSTAVAPGGAWYFTPESPLTDGVHSLTSTQTSPADNVSAASAPFALTIETGTPNTTAMLAANPHNTASTTYNQVLDGGGDPNASVTISDGGTVVATVQADASGAWSFDLAGLAAGSHSLVASETNAAGNTGASAAVPLTVAPAVVPDTRFTLATGDAATSGSFFGSDYAGPLPGLQAQYGYVGTDNVNVIANVANTFIYSGTAGEDAMVANSGSNVLDSRGGSDWMIGASGADGGTDTFFVDSRASGSPTTWDTALNFHLGDKLTIWDFSPTSGTMSFIDNLGQPGYLGTTLLANLGNGATDLVTFAGLSGAGAQFATSTGVSGGLGYLALTRVA